MATIQRFEDIEAWKKARQLTKNIYKVTSEGKWAKDFGLRDQIRRATVSIMSNVAEGFERQGSIEFRRFLAIAKASAAEVRSQLYIALDLEYIDQPTFCQLFSAVEETSCMISGFIKYLETLI